TSAGMGLPPPSGWMRHNSPTVHSGPRPSMVSPTRRVTVPMAGTSAAPSSAALTRAITVPPGGRGRSVDTAHHCSQLLRDARESRLHPGVQLAALCLDQAAAAGDPLIAYPLDARTANQMGGQVGGHCLDG